MKGPASPAHYGLQATDHFSTNALEPPSPCRSCRAREAAFGCAAAARLNAPGEDCVLERSLAGLDSCYGGLVVLLEYAAFRAESQCMP
ncbi:hypothetical protein EMIT0P176_20125 [Pseudomonas sp. IT-P176]